MATDDSSLVDAVAHAWAMHRTSSGAAYDYVVVLQPTSPLRSGLHIKEAIELYFQEKRSPTTTLASVFKVNPKFGWLLKKTEPENRLRFCFDVNNRNPQRQKLIDYFLPNGSIFIVKGGEFSAGFYGDDTVPYVMDSRLSVDIDFLEDFKMAEKFLLYPSHTLK